MPHTSRVVNRHTGPSRRYATLLSTALAVMYFATAVAFAVASGTSAHEDDLFYEADSPWNGKKIYLSPAYHTDVAGARGECDAPYDTPRTERTMARMVASAIANFGGSSLTARHYKVRMGRNDPTTNTSRSNNWNANIHIPLHSNAHQSAPGCRSDDLSLFGTRQIYKTEGGEALATEIKQAIDDVTPGTNDKKCTISACTEYSCLIELCDIDARASYSETEFHDWAKGTNFLHDRTEWYWRFGYAIDTLLGYPR